MLLLFVGAVLSAMPAVSLAQSSAPSLLLAVCGGGGCSRWEFHGEQATVAWPGFDYMYHAAREKNVYAGAGERCLEHYRARQEMAPLREVGCDDRGSKMIPELKDRYLFALSAALKFPGSIQVEGCHGFPGIPRRGGRRLILQRFHRLDDINNFFDRHGGRRSRLRDGFCR